MTRATRIGVILAAVSLAAGIFSTFSDEVTPKIIALVLSFVALVGAGVAIGIQVAAERRKVSAARRAEAIRAADERAAEERASGDDSARS
ncbi:hypothetical protein D9V32_15950 [Mycetocola tolaasinivorans]|uniref:Uncharacterized protein n=2 Tax=Mycetocola tolaasinivorans TaxID=76635 RepID=A0A3L6ZVK9_9MICO|nr:hypothetical protein D9V32_15950 [Mycetocola tolaasinivorans]